VAVKKTDDPAAPDRAPPAPPTAAELDAVLRVLEARAPGLRKAGVGRLVVGSVRADLTAAPEEPNKDGGADEDDDPDTIFDVKKYRGNRGRERSNGGSTR
jgi:hypothetical protein